MQVNGDLRSIAAKAADHLLSYRWKLWFWGDSIGLEGLLDASELTADGKYLGFVHGLLKGWIARQRFRSDFDYTAPGVALLRTYQATGDAALLDAARAHAAYLEGFRRTAGGAYVRYENAAIELPPEVPGVFEIGTPPADGGPCIFVDSIHFDGPFFAKLYEVTGERRYRTLAVTNILPQVELLYDSGQRLFHHFWMERTGRPNGVLWARGNGWGLLGVALTLEAIGTGTVAGCGLVGVLRDGIERLAELQDHGGAWHTILNDPDSYIESSTAAFFIDAICRAIRLGLVPAGRYHRVLETAMQFLVRHVNADGVLDGVSYETFPSTRPEHYRHMPRGAVVPWGQGPLIAAIRSYLELAQPAREGLETGEQLHATR
jgi:unsaturated rhamnogalacturonyl hydrolase